ncbi:hypothetical protein FB382_004380 [Nocardioides ginsengisegetis]|uniref:Uncharacterized protein n=1 Tax=Nocardioides ginsengisegetis TaxID=661491 RepID=A0A7W3J4G2_9ACTN|nr:hypothetical protein [Nocardioides ginsengisegetis]
MALSELAATVNAELPHRTCQVCHALAGIPTAEAAGLRSLLANPGLKYTAISDMVAADPDTPLLLHPDALSRHARGRCGAREMLR